MINFTPEIKALFEMQKKDEKILGGMTINIGRKISTNKFLTEGIEELIEKCRMNEADKQFLGL